MITQEMERLKSRWIRPGTDSAKQLETLIDQPIKKESSLFDFLKRPDIDYRKLASITQLGPCVTDTQVIGQVETTAKYSGYIDRQNQEINAKVAFEACSIPLTFDYAKVSGLSCEVQQKLTECKPSTLGAASRIAGVTPAAISLLTIYMKKLGLIRSQSPSTLGV